MPTSKINKDAREGKGSKKTLEKKWDESKKAAEKSADDPSNPYPLAMYIYKKKTHQASILTGSTLRLATTTPEGEIDVTKLEASLKEE